MIIIKTRDWREETLRKIAVAWKSLYPKQVAWFTRELRKLREVTKDKGKYTDVQGRSAFVEFRLPTVLWMYCQRIIPDFGKTTKDIQLVVKVFDELARATPLTRKPIYDSKAAREKRREHAEEAKAEEGSARAAERGDDHSGLPDFVASVPPKSEGQIPAAAG